MGRFLAGGSAHLALGIFLSLVLAQGALAQGVDDRPGIVVLLPNITGLPKSAVDPTALVDIAASVAGETGEYRILSHEDVRSMLTHEQDKQLAGCTDAGCMAEIGAALGAAYLLSTNVTVISDRILIALTLIDNRKVAALKRQAITVREPKHVLDAVRVATSRMFGRPLEMPLPTTYGVWRWTTLGSGLAIAALGGLGMGLTARERDRADQATTQADLDDARSAGETWNTVGIAGLVVGGALLASSLVFFLIPDEETLEVGDGPGSPVLGIVPLPGGGVCGVAAFAF